MAVKTTDFIRRYIPKIISPFRQIMTRIAETTTDNVGRNNQANVYEVSSQLDMDSKAIQIYMSMGNNYKGKKMYALMMMSQCLNVHQGFVKANEFYPYFAEKVLTEKINNKINLLRYSGKYYDKDSALRNIDIEDFNPNKLLKNEYPITAAIGIGSGTSATQSYPTAAGFDVVTGFDDSGYVTQGYHVTMPVSPMYFVWYELYKDAEEKDKSQKAEEIARKIQGVNMLKNNFEAIVRYCRLMKLNAYSDRTDSDYDVVGLITALEDINYGDDDNPIDYQIITYNDLRTQATEQQIYYNDNDLKSNIIGMILLSDTIELDGHTWIDRKDSTPTSIGTGTPKMKIETDDTEEEAFMWDALGADASYSEILPGITDDFTNDSKRNFEYEKDMTLAQLDNFRYRNLTALGNFYLSVARYAERMANEAEDGSDDQKVWERIKTDAYIMFKRYKNSKQPQQQNGQ